MNAERTREPVELLRQLHAVRTAGAGEGRADAKGELAEIEKALARLAHCTYGICVACGSRIAPERLELLPATPYCLRCAIERVHDPGHPEPTVTSGSLRGDQVRFFTDTELGTLLSMARHDRMLARGNDGRARRAKA
jgi:DksA/TraR C4-type zinc finger protein